MDRDENLPGFIRINDDAGSRLGQEKAALKPWDGFGMILVAAETFQACAAGAFEASFAATR